MAEIQKYFVNANGDAFVVNFKSQAAADAHVVPEGVVGIFAPAKIGSDWDGAKWVERPPAPEVFAELSRPAFLYMAELLGLDDAAIRALIDKLPETTVAEKKAKRLAMLVYENQQTFRRDNNLLQVLGAMAGLTNSAIDTAWREGAALVW